VFENENVTLSVHCEQDEAPDVIITVYFNRKFIVRYW